MKINQCSFCGGELKDELTQHEYRGEGKLFVFEDVPAEVCQQCGEKYFDLKVVEAMEQAVLRHLQPKRTLIVPLYSYREVMPA
jgi:YgiT-type zinc finger domain-containing protein